MKLQKELFTTLYTGFCKNEKIETDPNIMKLLNSDIKTHIALAISTIYEKHFFALDQEFIIEYSGGGGSADIDIAQIDEKLEFIEGSELLNKLTEVGDYSWWKDDGGSGTITVDLMTGTIQDDGQWYETHAVSHFTISELDV